MPGKWIYLAQRNPRFTREQFFERWLAHRRIGTPPAMLGEFAAGFYCAAHPDALALEGRSEEYDGAGVFSLNGLHSIPTVAQCLKLDYIQADEKRFFASTAESCSLFGAENVLRDGSDTDTVVLQFLRRHRDVSATDFAQRWRTEQAAAILANPAFTSRLSRYVQNTIVAPPPPGYGYDGVAELWFGSVADVAACATGLNRLMTACDFVDAPNSFCLLTRTIMSRPRAKSH
jgi:hypothetical protein